MHSLTLYKKKIQWDACTISIYFIHTKTKKLHIACILFSDFPHNQYPCHPCLKTLFLKAKIQILPNNSYYTSKHFFSNLDKKNNTYGKLLLDNYFTNKNTKKCAHSFEKKVWYSLCDIPYGTVVSYSDIAQKTHCPLAYRSVGTAIGKNPFPLFVPCHRVIPKSSILLKSKHPFPIHYITTHSVGSYRGGRNTKTTLLQYEYKKMFS